MNRAELRAMLPELLRAALLGEVYTTPKPGLVDLHDTGAHRDMDAHSFERSTEAIVPYLYEMFLMGMGEGAGASSGHADAESSTLEEQLFLAIRETGKAAELAMLQATQGVNTHKGMIFTMGILCGALGLAYRPGYRGEASRVTPEELLDLAQRMTERILHQDFQEMQQREPRTHGERLYHRYGEEGIRGQAMRGFPILRETALPAIRREETLAETMFPAERRLEHDDSPASLIFFLPDWEAEKLALFRDLSPMENAVQLNVLLSIMAELNDTNVLTRSDYDIMLTLKKEAQEILRLGGAFTKEGMEALLQLKEACIRRNVSPGGAADILAVTLFLHQLERLS